MRTPLALLMILSLSGCAALCGPEPPDPGMAPLLAQGQSFEAWVSGPLRQHGRATAERNKWLSCMGYLPDPAVPVRIVR